jgi:hypothetical protein
MSPVSETTIVGAPGKGSVSVPSDFVHSDGSVTSFTVGETFALGSCINFGSLDFLATAAGDLRLPTPMRPPLRSQENLHASLLGARWRSDASKGVALPSSDVLTDSPSPSSKRHREPHLQRLWPSSTTSQLPSSTYLSHDSTEEPDSDTFEAVGMAFFVATLPQKRMVAMHREDEKHPLLGA